MAKLRKDTGAKDRVFRTLWGHERRAPKLLGHAREGFTEEQAILICWVGGQAQERRGGEPPGCTRLGLSREYILYKWLSQLGHRMGQGR